MRWDVLNGYVSVEAARDTYGVILDPKTLALDAAGTAQLRDKKQAASATKE